MTMCTITLVNVRTSRQRNGIEKALKINLQYVEYGSKTEENMRIPFTCYTTWDSNHDHFCCDYTE